MRATLLIATAIVVAGVGIRSVSVAGSGRGSGSGTDRVGSVHRVLVLTPLDVEFDAASSVLTSPKPFALAGREAKRGRAHGLDVLVVRTGWAKAHAAAATAQAIAAFHPDLVLLAGIGGGLDARIADTGDVVVVTTSWQADLGERRFRGFVRWPPESASEAPWPSRFVSDSRASGAMASWLRLARFPTWTLYPDSCKTDAGLPRVARGSTRWGRVGRPIPITVEGGDASEDQFLADDGEWKWMLATSGAIVVDMEAGAVAQECRVESVRFASVRVVADIVATPDSDYLYYCLKPQAARELRAVVDLSLEAIATMD